MEPRRVRTFSEGDDWANAVDAARDEADDAVDGDASSPPERGNDDDRGDDKKGDDDDDDEDGRSDGGGGSEAAAVAVCDPMPAP